jgi:hypothetical protein
MYSWETKNSIVVSSYSIAASQHPSFHQVVNNGPCVLPAILVSHQPENGGKWGIALTVLPATNLNPLSVIVMVKVDNGTPICISVIVFLSRYTSIYSDFHDLLCKDKTVQSIVTISFY